MKRSLTVHWPIARWRLEGREPKAVRAASLAIRLVASMRAFVMPVSVNARICDHQTSMPRSESRGALARHTFPLCHGLSNAFTGCGPPFISIVKISAPSVSG
jgi:hypothetical protein